MRALVVALALLALAAPAAAQNDPLAITLTMTPFEGPVAPGFGFGFASLNATMPCALALNAAPQQAATLRFVVEASPNWSEPVVFPAQVNLTTEMCKGTSIHALAQVFVGVTDDAPAGAAEPFRVNASITGPLGTKYGTASQDLVAGYRGAIDVAANATSAKILPGQTATFRVTVENKGNDKVRVAPAWAADPPAGWRLAAIDPALVGSAQKGDNATSTTFLVAITAPAVEGAVKDTKTFSLRVSATRDGDASDPPTTRTLGFTVTSERVVETPTPKPFGVPGPAGALVALALAGAAVLVRARRG
ncbi:MAG TPA: hypothetical protein VM889_09205 [Candidatus Thermoplasmatota archaeon]|nr:hypothetical protein [Candidatus Thermoplasmatota archaeon]